jgi:isopenicillin-N N-acyltransferase-like protein
MQRSSLLLVVLICCLSAAVVSPTLAEGRRTSIGSGADAIPVVIVSGTPYEMGLSYGGLMASEVNACMTGYLALAQAYDPARYSNANLDSAWATVEPYVNTRFIEEMQGVAAGAGVSYDKVRRAHCISLVSDYACSDIAVWGAASANGHLYQIRNLDYEKEAGLQNYPVIVVYLPQSGVPHANVAFAGLVGSMAGMNAEGVALSEKGASPAADYPFDLNGIPFIVMFRDILQDCHSLDQAVDLVTNAARIKKYYYVIGDGQQPAAVKIRAFAPGLDIWTDNDPADEVYPNVRPNVVYKTMDDTAAWNHINANYGSYDADRMIDLSRLVHSDGGNLMNVVYDATSLEMWIAYAEGTQDAADRPYVHFNLHDYIPAQTVGGYGFYEVIGTGADQITVLYTGGTHYEMGYWHGRLLRDQVRANAASAIAAAEGEGITEETWQMAIALMWPHVSQEYLDEMQGLADGSGLTLETVWKVHAIPDLSEYHCSAFAAMGAATVNGHCIQLRNLDYGLELGIQDHPLLEVCEPTGRNRYVNVTFAGMIGSIAGMSYQHLPVSEMGDSFDYDNETLDGEPFPFLLKDVLEQAQSYSEAEDIVGNAARTSSLWYTVSDPEEGQAGLMMTSPTIFNVYHLGDSPGGTLPALPDVIYGGYYNDRLYNDLSTNWGKIDPAVSIAISVNNAMNSNLMNAVYDATTLEMWVAYAEGWDRAANRPYIYFNMNYGTQPVPKLEASTLSPFVNEPVDFSAAGSSHPNPNHSIVKYEWDWDNDGVYDATGVSASHAYATEGTYTVTLRVTDDFIPGNTATATATVQVSAHPTITRFQINGGATLTTALAATLSISCERAAQMRFRNDGGTWGDWMPYASTTPWQLAAGAEGWRRVDARCITGGGLASFAVSALIYYDTPDVPPTGKVVINNRALYTTSLDVTLSLYATGATQFRLKNAYGDPWGPWEPYHLLATEPYCQTKSWRLAAGGDGQREVYVQYCDTAGSLSAPRVATICYDTSAPPTGRILINGGAGMCDSRSVTLNLRATAAAEMRFRNRDTDPWSEWRPYAATTPWNLAVGSDGWRTVYGQFRDYLGNVSDSVSVSIWLDTPAPPVGRVWINNGDQFTLRREVTLTISAVGAARMRFKHRYSDDFGPWLPYRTTLGWQLLAGNDGLREVYGQFQDRLGNLSAVVCATIFYDTFQPPNLVYFRINNNAATTSTTAVTLSIAAYGAIQMRFRNGEYGSWSEWLPYAGTAPWTLPAGANGTRIVYAQCRDCFGNPSQTQADAITLEQ